MDFWEQFWPQISATAVGVLIGFPITIFATFLGAGLALVGALWINRKQENKQQQKEKQEEKRRKDKILVSLKDELEDNLKGLKGWDESDYEKGTLSARLKTESWKAFSEGGELQWVEDPNILFFLSEAYAAIKAVQNISEKYFQLKIIQSRYVHTWQLDKVDKDINKKVSYARQVINGVLGYLETYIEFVAEVKIEESLLRNSLRDAKEGKYDLD